jgi:hypothetical protein
VSEHLEWSIEFFFFSVAKFSFLTFQASGFSLIQHGENEGKSASLQSVSKESKTENDQWKDTQVQ